MKKTNRLSATFRLSRVATLIIATSTAAFGTTTLFAAESTQPQASPTKPGATAPQRMERQRQPQLFTADEHKQFRERMQNAKTAEERDAVRKEARATYEQRAKEKGITLPQRAQGAAPRGAPDHHAGRSDRGDKPRAETARTSGRETLAKLLTPEEQTQYRERMKNAKDRAERATVGKELHALVTQRAREKGVTLPERKEGGRRGHHDHGISPRTQS